MESPRKWISLEEPVTYLEPLPAIHKITYQGEYLKWQVPNWRLQPKGEKGRGEVTHFSVRSRFRVFCLMMKIDWSKIGKSLFVTLTYPNFLRPNDKDEMNVHRALFARYVEGYKEKHVVILWRVEWQDRKTGPMRHYLYPHIHLLVLNVQYIHHSKVNGWWRKIIGYHPKRKLRTETKRAYGAKGCLSYVSKYCGKIGSLVIGPYLNNPIQGRQWGILRRKELPLHEEHYVETTMNDELWQAYSQGFKANGDVKYNNQSFTLFGPQAAEIGSFLFGSGIDGEIFDV